MENILIPLGSSLEKYIRLRHSLSRTGQAYVLVEQELMIII